MKIKNITKENFKGNVYNLELNSNIREDDLYWIEGTTDIVTHNCFPKDVNALLFMATQFGLEVPTLSSNINSLELYRKDKDWTKQIGRAVSEE